MLTGDLDPNVFILTVLSTDKRVTTRISHIYHIKGKAVAMQKQIHANFREFKPSPAQESVPEELEVFDCLYLGSTQLKKKYDDAMLTSIYNDGIALRKQIKDERKKQKLGRLHIANTMLDLDGDGSPEAVEEHPVCLVMTNKTFRITDSITGNTLWQFLTSTCEFVGELESGLHPEKEGGKEEGPEKVLALVTKNKQVKFTAVHHFFPLREDNKDMMVTIRDMAKRAIGTYDDLVAAGPFTPAEGAEVEATPESLMFLSRDRATLTAVAVVAAGEFGEVFLATEHVKSKAGKMVDSKRAVKTLKGAADAVSKALFARKAMTMIGMGNHKNLCHLKGLVMQQAPWLSVFEYCAYGDLKQIVETFPKRGEKLVAGEQIDLCNQIAQGCKWMISRKIIHMDLALKNILLAKGNAVKIADFDEARPFDKGTDQVKLKSHPDMAVKWCSPEAFQTLTFSEKSDVWAAGVCFWEVLSYGQDPWGTETDAGTANAVLKGQRLGPPAGTDPAIWAVVVSTWAPKAEQRPDFEKLCAAFDTLAAKFPITTKRDIGATAAGEIAFPDDEEYESDEEFYAFRGDAMELTQDAMATYGKVNKEDAYKSEPKPKGGGWGKLKAAYKKASILGGLATDVAVRNMSVTVKADGTKSDEAAFDWGGLGTEIVAHDPNDPSVTLGLEGTEEEQLAAAKIQAIFKGQQVRRELAEAKAKKMGVGLGSMLGGAGMKAEIKKDKPMFLTFKKPEGPLGLKIEDGPDGPKITKVGAGSVAFEQQFQVGDLVLEINKTDVSKFKGAKCHEIVKAHKAGNMMSFRIQPKSERLRTTLKAQAAAKEAIAAAKIKETARLAAETTAFTQIAASEKEELADAKKGDKDAFKILQTQFKSAAASRKTLVAERKEAFARCIKDAILNEDGSLKVTLPGIEVPKKKKAAAADGEAKPKKKKAAAADGEAKPKKKKAAAADGEAKPKKKKAAAADGEAKPKKKKAADGEKPKKKKESEKFGGFEE
jgi:serine/threonine protein kinase